MWIFAAFFVYVGVTHFTNPDLFVGIMPPFLSQWALELTYISGFFEILGGVGLLIPKTRRWAAWGLIALLIAVFPANIHMAINNVPLGGEHLPPAALWGRLPLQFVFIGIAWWFTRPEAPRGTPGESPATDTAPRR